LKIEDLMKALLSVIPRRQGSYGGLHHFVVFAESIFQYIHNIGFGAEQFVPFVSG
jgi:hypothetical protein